MDWTLLVCTLLSAGSLGAQTAPAEPCDAAGNNTAWRQCQGDRAAKADKELNDLYGKLMAKLSPEAQASLRAIERTWIEYRDAQCKAEAAQYEGGTLQPGIEASCLAKEAEFRIKDLHAAYEGP